ncbi:MAG: MFS transporter [Leptolyngbya sp. BL-A-14]
MPTKTSSRSPHHSLKALDRLNVTLGDVRDVFEPYLAIFLATERHWNPAQVGFALAITNIAGILTQTPIGALVDASKHKRLLIAIAAVTIAISYLIITSVLAFPAVIAAQAGIGIAAVTIIPAVSAISLGLVGQDRLEQRISRNEAFNRTGNTLTAVIAGVLAHFAGLTWIFYLLVLLCVATTILIFRVQSRDIDNTVARSDDSSASDQSQSQPRASVKDLLSDRTLVNFSVAVFLFYAANAALLPLVGQQLTGGQSNTSSAFLSACIAISQFTTIPVAAWAGKAADRWGRKPLLLLAFAATTLRAFLYGMSANPWFIVGVQTLDGIASGIFAVLLVVVVADLTKGTGRFNLAQGGLYTMIGIGAALSNLAIGLLVKVTGFGVGFFTLSTIAAMGMLWLWLTVPETKARPDGKE